MECAVVYDLQRALLSVSLSVVLACQAGVDVLQLQYSGTSNSTCCRLFKKGPAIHYYQLKCTVFFMSTLYHKFLDVFYIDLT